MGFMRSMVREAGVEREAKQGEGMLAHVKWGLVTTAGNLTLTVPQVLGGIAAFSGAAGAVAYTLPLATDLIAAMPNMDIGDTYTFIISNSAAQNATITTNTGITLSGNGAVVNAGFKILVLEKTSSTTMNCYIV